MDLVDRVKKLEEKVEMLMALLLVEKKLNVDVSKFPTKAKSFK